MSIKNTILLSCLAASTVLFLPACTSGLSPNNYKASDVGVASKVLKGSIIAIRPVDIKGNSGVGGLAGAVAGGAAGSAIGGTTAMNIVGAVGGAVAGGLIGNEADKALHNKQGYEYIIQLNTGSTISVTQTEDLQLAVNQHVLVIYGEMTRIIPDNTVSTPAPTPAPVAKTSSTKTSSSKASK